MANPYFRFKQFTVHQDRSAMKVTTDGCLFGAWISSCIESPFRAMLDIGTGTGLLSLMIAQRHEGKMDAIEIDPEACQQAVENIASSPWKNRINVICGDIRKQQEVARFDIIISNPPFYENELKSDDAKKNTAHHGDQLTLKDLLLAIKSMLLPGGSFFILLPYKRWPSAQTMIVQNQLTIEQVVLVKQSVKHAPFRVMVKGKNSEQRANIDISEISVWDNKQQYTNAFRELLSSYYLAL